MGASRVAKRLWMGSKPQRGPSLAKNGFNVLVLCADEEQPNAHEFPGLDRVIYVPLDDTKELVEGSVDVSPDDVQRVRRAAKEIHDLHRRGARILITCRVGMNRSGLVTAVTMCHMGFAPIQAISLIRSAREVDPITHRFGGVALYNRAFVKEVLKCRPAANAHLSELR